MSTNRGRDWARGHYDYPDWVLACHACGRPLDECACVCPFCGERNACGCCIGLGVATGGD